MWTESYHAALDFINAIDLHERNKSFLQNICFGLFSQAQTPSILLIILILALPY